MDHHSIQFLIGPETFHLTQDLVSIYTSGVRCNRDYHKLFKCEWSCLCEYDQPHHLRPDPVQLLTE